MIPCQVLRDRQRLLTMLDRFFLAGQATGHLGETQKSADPFRLELRIFTALLDELLVKGRFGLQERAPNVLERALLEARDPLPA